MDNYTIFTKTAKGLGEALGKTKNLSREQRKILKEIDGKASFEDLVEQIGMDEVKLGAVINKLLADDYIREFGSSAPPGARPSGETVFDLTSPGIIEVANSQLTIGDFFRAMETPPAQSGDAGVDFRNLGHPEAEIARKTLEQTAAQVDEIRRAIEEEAQRITARTQQQAAEAARREAETKAQQEAERARQQALAQEQARAKQEAEEQARRAAQEQARKAAEEAERQAARIRAEQEARRLAEEAARREAEERARRQAEEQARRQAEEAARRLAQEQAQEQARIKAEQEARVAAEARAREEAAEQERARLQAMEEERRAAEARAREEAEARARREAEEQARRQQEEEARRVAEEEARKQAQEQARIKAWEAARRAAEELAQREAEEKARVEAERLAQIRAEEEARLAAEAEARRQAEEAARLAAEAAARREAEEQARRRAEEEARQAAEEKARREAEELAKKEAQERARQEAEEAARLKAEEKARQQAEAKARKEAEAQAKREAREQARREAEERARQEAERKAQLAAEEKARKEAEAQARHEAKEKARQAAEEAARQKAEAAARLKAEKEAEKAARAAAKEAEKAAREAAKKAAKEAAKEAAIGAAKSAAEEAGKTESAVTAAANAGSQTSQRAEDAIDAALPETASSSRSIRITLPFSLGKLVRVSALALAALSVAGLGLIHIVPFNGRLAQLEQEAGAQFGKPVKIGSLNLSLLPQPHWRLQEVSIGADNEIVIPQVNATAVIGSLFSGPMQFHSVELVSPVIDEKGLGWILFGQAPGTPWQVTSVNASQVKLRMRQVQVPLFNASAEFDNAGVWRKIDLNAPAEKLHVDLARAEGAPRFEFTANDLVLPFGGTLAFDTLNASGTIERGGLDIGKFSAIIYDGTVSGSATLRWQDGWSFKGAAQARHVAPVRLAPGLFHGGTLEGDFSYAMQSAEADRLLASPQARGSFSVNGGTLTGVDMASHVMGQAGTGKTSFNELNGDFTYEGGKVKLSRMRLAAGLLSAGGEAAVDADGKLSGHVTVDLRTASRQAHSAFNIGGTPAEPKFSR